MLIPFLSPFRRRPLVGWFGVIVIAALLPAQALSATVNVPASATVFPPLTLSEPAEMRFGSIASSFASGTAVIDLPATLPAVAPTTATPIITSTRSATGSVALIGGTTCSATINCGAGSIQISGLANGTFSTVSVPATFNVTSGADNMVVGTMRVRYGVAGTTGVTLGPGALSASGAGLVVFTGTLFVGATQATGVYTGTIAVTVDY